MTRGKLDADLTLTIGGKGAFIGSLGPDDLLDLGEFLKALRDFDPSLGGIRMAGRIREGSAIVDVIAPTPEGLAPVRPARDAIQGFFKGGGYDEAQGWTWRKGPREALKRLTGRGCSLRAEVPQAGAALFKIELGRKEYEAYSKKIAQEPTWTWMKGKLLEVDYKDRTFEIHTAKGILICPFPASLADAELDGKVRKTVSVHAQHRPKPATGSWKAEACQSVLLVPESPGLGLSAYPVGIHPPVRPMPQGFDLATFAPSLDAAAGDELGQFLQTFEG